MIGDAQTVSAPTMKARRLGFFTRHEALSVAARVVSTDAVAHETNVISVAPLVAAALKSETGDA